MKKILALLVCLLIVSISVRADDDRPVRVDQLPVKAQAYVKKYFPQERWRWQRWKRISLTRSMK